MQYNVGKVICLYLLQESQLNMINDKLSCITLV